MAETESALIVFHTVSDRLITMENIYKNIAVVSL